MRSGSGLFDCFVCHYPPLPFRNWVKRIDMDQHQGPMNAPGLKWLCYLAPTNGKLNRDIMLGRDMLTRRKAPTKIDRGSSLRKRLSLHESRQRLLKQLT